jgi:hypothetical protein
VATNNTVQYTITAKDQASAVFAQVATKAKGVGAGIAESFVLVGAAAYKMRGVVSDGFKVMSGDFTKLGNVFGAIPGPVGEVGRAVGNALGSMIQDTVDAVKAFDKLSQATGASVEFLSGFTEAADDMRISSDTVSASLTIFSRKLGGIEDVMDGSGVSAGAFAEKLAGLGITTDNMQEALFQVADIFQQMPNGVDKAALAVELFGKQGTALIPILNKGREGIRGMMDDAKATGKVIDEDLRDKVIKLAEAQDKLDDSFGGLKTRIGAELIPAFLNLVEGINTYMVATGKTQQETDLLVRTVQALQNALKFWTDGTFLEPALDALERFGKAATMSFLGVKQPAAEAVEAAQEVGAAIGAVESKEVTLTVSGSIGASFDSARTTYQSMSDKTVTVSINYSANDPYAELPGRARGGPVKKGKAYKVGENGEEMFVPYTSGYIVPNSAPYAAQGQRAAGASAGTFNVNNPSIIINSVNGAAIAQEIARKNSNVARQARAKATIMG